MQRIALVSECSLLTRALKEELTFTNNIGYPDKFPADARTILVGVYEIARTQTMANGTIFQCESLEDMENLYISATLNGGSVRWFKVNHAKLASALPTSQ